MWKPTLVRSCAQTRLAALRSRKIHYISQGPLTMARDLRGAPGPGWFSTERVEFLLGLRGFGVKFCGDLCGKSTDKFLNDFEGKRGRRHLRHGLVNNYINQPWVDHSRDGSRSLARLYNFGFGRRPCLGFRWGDINPPFRGFSEGKTIQAGHCYGRRVLFFNQRMRLGNGGSSSQFFTQHRFRSLSRYVERHGSIGWRLDEFRR